MTSTTAGIEPASTTPAGTIEPAGPDDPVRPFGAALAATALVLGAAGNTAQAVMTQLLGGRPETIDDMVTLATESPTLVTAMSVTGTVALPFMALGFVAAAHLLARQARRTGRIAGTLLVLGMWGFLGLQLTGLVQIRALARRRGRTGRRDVDAGPAGGHAARRALRTAVHGRDRARHARADDRPARPGAGVPRWIPGVWLVFIVLDFTVGAVGPVDPHWLYLLGAVGLAHHVLKDGGAGVDERLTRPDRPPYGEQVAADRDGSRVAVTAARLLAVVATGLAALAVALPLVERSGLPRAADPHA